MDIKSKSNPIGIIQNIPELEQKIKNLMQEWDDKIKVVSAGWLYYFGAKGKVTLSLVTSFLLFALDELITAANEVLISGPDKKATVLSGLDKLYEYVIKEALPIWLRPFASAVKQYVIYSLASYAIDYIVLKYKNGNWKTTGG
jgi:hypothetical protein